MDSDEERRRKRRVIYDRWRTNNREEYLAAQRRNKAKNGHKWREKDRERARLWLLNNKERARIRSAEYRKAHRAEACAREKARRLANPEKKKSTDSEYRLTNTEKIRSKGTSYRAKNRDSLKLKRKAKYQLNKAEISKKYREEYAKDPARFLIKNKASRSKPEFKEKLNARVKYRKKTDIQFRIACSIRSRIKKCISKEYRKGGTLTLLGCSVVDVKRHIESLFLPGMSWSNYGYRGWHIDHIHPLAKFDLTNPVDVARACHFTNLQPLWWLDNIRKHDRVVGCHIAAAGIPGCGV